MSEIEPITDHFHAAILKLVPPFWGKPRVASLLRAMVNRVQELEDAGWEVMNAYDVDQADATRLAILGKIVGQINYGWSLETYRAVVRAKIRANQSRGLTDDLCEVIQIATGSTGRVFVRSYAPATVFVWIEDGLDAAHLVALEFLLPKTRAAGVQQHFFWTEDGLSTGAVWDEATYDDGTLYWSEAVL